jgi:catechol 2,3-dioxygenase-like lactoylglutathione lyase family enzyme
MTGVIEREIGGVFVPVSDIERARDWYRAFLGLEPSGEIFFGHIHVVPMAAGSGLVLDSKGFAGPHDRKPAFHFNTRDIAAAREQAVALGARDVGPVTDGVFFTFKAPDGNLMMVADVPPAPRS